MARLSLPFRVGLIVVMALIAGWLAFMALVYVDETPGSRIGLPDPQRLAALTDLVEAAAPDERQRILQAVRTPFFVAVIAPPDYDPPEASETAVVDSDMLQDYRAALPGRALTVVMQSDSRRLQRFPANRLNAVEFRIGLGTGETLLVATESPFLIAPFGLPVGFGAALIGILIALVTLIVLHRQFRPLSRLAAAVDDLDPTDANVALPPIRARSPEVRALVGAFERLQARLATLVRARMALVGGIQHDLRTFATRLRLRIDKIADPDDRDRAATDIAHMIALLDDALLANRAGVSELDQELIDLAPLVAAEVADRRAAGAEATFAAGPGGAEAAVLGDRLALRRITANLLDNAIKYGHAARASVSVEAHEVVLRVDDDGPGIPPDRRAFLFEPFTRLDASRARATGGAGLGLAVVRSLVAAHGGTVEIGDAPAGGARLSVRLPAFGADGVTEKTPKTLERHGVP